jgi:hypothetical protein
MNNNQGNRKGTAQDQREHANQVQQGDSKDPKNTQRPTQVPREKGGADAGRGRDVGSEPGTTP